MSSRTLNIILGENLGSVPWWMGFVCVIQIAFYISITVLNQNDGTAVLGPGLIENSEIMSEFHTTAL